MFNAFFYVLKANGVAVSLTEWMTLMEGLRQNLHRSTFSGFYRLCRATLVKRERDYDSFDAAFLSFFQGIRGKEPLSEKLLEWLNNPSFHPPDRRLGKEELTPEEVLRQLEERLEQQKLEHHGGNRWIGTQGYTSFGADGMEPGGIRIAGKSRHSSAFQVAEERRYRDFRDDNQLDTRQFEMAFRLLRQLSGNGQRPETEFDVERTVRATGDRGGLLSIRYRRPRENAIQLLLLMDSGGSIEEYSRQCSMLFQAASRANRFRRFEICYFHNCVKSVLYTDPTLGREHRVPTEQILRRYGADCRVILVGDATMAPDEFFDSWIWQGRYQPSGADWLFRLSRHFPHIIWLNPKTRPAGTGYFVRSYDHIAETVSMYPLTMSGLEQGMKHLLN